MSDTPRGFAVKIVRRLREAGFEAYWAGGCVRDELLGREPDDYDVATSAPPEEIRRIFGRRRTLSVGAAFGVITVIGPPGAGNVEVATFRRDATYSDGRHPDHVVFTSAAEDAARRDFTINGLFFDPIERRVLDFVGGHEDLRRRVVRAIGDPRQRFAEDKLRMLRAVRFAATLDFALDVATAEAVRAMAAEIAIVSAERVGWEMRRMLVHPHCAAAVRLLIETGLAPTVWPEILPDVPARADQLALNLAVAERLADPEFPTVLAAVIRRLASPECVWAIAARWRLSNDETRRTEWLLACFGSIEEAPRLPWSRLQPILSAPGAEQLLRLAEASTPAAAAGAAHCRKAMAEWPERLDPPPLITGEDLLRRGIPAGPLYRWLLAEVRAAQLDGRVGDQPSALALADELLGQGASRASAGSLPIALPKPEDDAMDKKGKKKVQLLHQRIQNLRQQLAGSKKQMDDPAELRALEQQLAAAEAELAKLKEPPV